MENRYGLKELNNFLAVVRNRIGMAIAIAYSGDKDFNQSQFGLAYAKNLGKVNIGLRFNYNISSYESKISYELGSIWKITEKFFSGIQVTGRSPSVYSIGAGYECSEQLFITATIVKEESRPVNVQAGIRYLLANAIQASFGLNSAISSPCIMLSWLWKGMQVSVCGSVHPQLGLSSGFGIIFYKERSEEGQ
jgi:hypothetical protein